MFLHLITVLSTLVYLVEGQCGSVDHDMCADWVANGFCDSAFYSLEQKQESCGEACKLCECEQDGVSTCAEWAADGFCTSSQYTATFKQQMCCMTCATVINPPPPTGCGILYNYTQPIVNFITGHDLIDRNLITNITKAFIKHNCTVTLFDGNDDVVDVITGNEDYVIVSEEARVATRAKCHCDAETLPEPTSSIFSTIFS